MHLMERYSVMNKESGYECTALTHCWHHATFNINRGICGSRARTMHTHNASEFIIFSHNSIVLSTSNLITQHAIQVASDKAPNRIDTIYGASHPGYRSNRNKPAHQHRAY